MALIITAPKEVYSVKVAQSSTLFLAGGITNCPDWQAEMIDYLKDIPDLVIYNPRREGKFSKSHEEEQIAWEYLHLLNASLISFWFARGSLNPIVLYELGMWGNSRQRPIFVGVDPEYERKADVMVQTQIANPDVDIVMSVYDLAAQVRIFLEDD
jgi:hypothetical protein